MKDGSFYFGPLETLGRWCGHFESGLKILELIEPSYD